MSEEFKRNPAQEELDDVRRIALSQGVRERIIAEMTKDGKIPEDNGDRNFLLSALDGLDRTSLSRMKIKVEDKAATAQAQASSMVADILNSLSSKTISQSIPQTDRVAPTLSNDVQVTDRVVGETSIGTQNQNYKEFMERNQNLLYKHAEGQQDE